MTLVTAILCFLISNGEELSISSLHFFQFFVNASGYLDVSECIGGRVSRVLCYGGCVDGLVNNNRVSKIKRNRMICRLKNIFSCIKRKKSIFLMS